MITRRIAAALNAVLVSAIAAATLVAGPAKNAEPHEPEKAKKKLIALTTSRENPKRATHNLGIDLNTQPGFPPPPRGAPYGRGKFNSTATGGNRYYRPPPP